jgi:hypothetical protein
MDEVAQYFVSSISARRFSMTTDTFTTSAVSTESVQRVRYSRLWWVGLLAIVLAVIANLLVRVIAMPFIMVPPEFLPLSNPVPTIMFTTLGVLAATIVFAIVGRFSRQPVRTFTIISVIALILSMIPNIFMLVDPASAPFPGANVGNVLILMLQHVIAAVVAVWVLVTQGVENLPAKN